MTDVSKQQVNGPLADTEITVKPLEAKIATHIFLLYALTPEEIKLVEGKAS